MGPHVNPLALSGVLFLGGALLSLVLAGRRALARYASCGLAALGSLILLVESVGCLLHEPASTLELAGPALLGGFRFGLDPFSALFSALISSLGLISSVYALGYAEEYDHAAGALGFFYNLFLLGMSWVPAAQNVFSFLFCWEAMTLTSFFLVILDHGKRESRQAGTLYFVMSQAGTAFILAAFFLLHRATGSWDFAAFHAVGPRLGETVRTAIFLFALIGFGTKAGIVPLHIWLPYAHPAAPSHVSSLMSGVMIKTGIYGFILVVWSFLGGGPWWWGALVLAVAAVSSVLGVLYALMEHDLKRLLAFHSVENIGIILMGVGAGMLAHAFGRADLSALALAAGLYHAINHAVFKGLLFLSAGSVLKATHTRDMEEMGGLIKLMPVTALCFLVGAMAISGLPPLNGFASEWLTYQALLSGFGLPMMAVRVLCLLAAAALALTGGLAAACFVKAFGVSFLALPRGERSAQAQDASMPEQIGMGILAAACVILGLTPAAAMRILKPLAEALTSVTPQGTASPMTIESLAPASAPYGGLFPPALLAVLTAAGLGAWALVRLLGGAARIRYGPTWGCGLRELTPRMEYTSTAFAKPFRMLFAFIYRPVREVRQDCVASPYFPKSIHYSSEITHLIQERLYRPTLRAMLGGARIVRRLQAGSVNIYLAYLSATLTALLLLSVWRAR